METFIQEIAKLLGVDPALIQGVAGTSFGGTLLLLARAWLLSKKTTEKQITFEQQLVQLANNSVDESRKLRTTFDNTAQILQLVQEALKELVVAARELRVEMPLKIAEHETATVKMFVDKADEMHKVTERRDEEFEEDRKKREEYQKELLKHLDILKKEVTDAEDETTLRSAVNKIISMLDEKPTE